MFLIGLVLFRPLLAWPTANPDMLPMPMEVWHITYSQYLRTLPQLLSFIASSMRKGMAIISKIVLAIELLGRSNGIGHQIHLHFQLFEIGCVMAYSPNFILFVLALQ